MMKNKYEVEALDAVETSYGNSCPFCGEVMGEDDKCWECGWREDYVEKDTFNDRLFDEY